MQMVTNKEKVLIQHIMYAPVSARLKSIVILIVILKVQVYFCQGVTDINQLTHRCQVGI